MHINYVQIGPLYTSRGPLLAKHLFLVLYNRKPWSLLAKIITLARDIPSNLDTARLFSHVAVVTFELVRYT